MSDFFDFETEPQEEKRKDRILWGFVLFFALSACAFLAVIETAFYLEAIR